MADELHLIHVAVFVSGRGSNLKALLEAQGAGRLKNVRFVLVFSDVENPPAFEHARKHAVPTAHLNPKSFKTKLDYEEAVVQVLKQHGVDWIVLAGYMRIVGPTLLAAFANRIINIHPSLLPNFPGLHAQKQAVEAKVRESGCTVHFVDSGVDSGPIILQRRVPCHPEDTEQTLAGRILEQEHQALPAALELISTGGVQLREGKVMISQV